MPCQRFFRCKKNDFRFIEAMPVDGAVPGNAYPDHWSPYKIWSGDKWECEGCGAAIVVGCGSMPLAIQHEPEFEDKIRRYGADQFQVNDC